MESSISFWTNSLLQMMSSYVFISGTQLSVIRYFPLPSFIGIILFATSRCESKEGRHLYLNRSPHTYLSKPAKLLFTIFLIKCEFLINKFNVSYNTSRISDPDLFYSHPLPLFLYYRLHRVYSIFRPSLWMLRYFSGPHPNHFIFLSIFSLF